MPGDAGVGRIPLDENLRKVLRRYASQRGGLRAQGPKFNKYFPEISSPDPIYLFAWCDQ